METSGWAIYYDDGKVFTHEDCSWEDAPAEGILAVVEKIGEKETVHSGADYYWRFEDGTIAASGDAATILRSLPWMKFGRYTSNTKMEQVFNRIRAVRKP